MLNLSFFFLTPNAFATQKLKLSDNIVWYIILIIVVVQYATSYVLNTFPISANADILCHMY